MDWAIHPISWIDDFYVCDIVSIFFSGFIFPYLSSAMLSEIDYAGDTASLKLTAHFRITLSTDFDLFLLGVEQFWYQFHYLLLYQRSEHVFTQMIPVSTFYGGDGGQVKTESWLFLQDDIQLLTRQSEHSLDLNTLDADGNPQHRYHEDMVLYEWADQQFRPTTVKNKSYW